MKALVASSRLAPWQPVAVAALSVVLGAGIASPERTRVAGLVIAAIAIATALSVSPHVFVSLSLALFATFQLSANHPLTLAGVSVYSTDLVLPLVVIRALSTRPRREVPWRVCGFWAGTSLAAWLLVLVVAGARGHFAAVPFKSVVRLDQPLLYYPILSWGFIRVMREREVSLPKVTKALGITSLAFVAYMGFERATHHRFENPNSTTGHLGSVHTAQGLTLHRDYGFYSAYDLYALAALCAICLLVFARKTRGPTIAIAVAFTTACALTLVRGIIFGFLAGAGLLLYLVWRSRSSRLGWPGVSASRLIALAVVLAAVGVVFASVSPGAARGVAGRVLPGLAAQSQAATQTAQYRRQALSFGYSYANTHPYGSGLITFAPEGPEDGYLAHSAWASVLVYTGWIGLAAFLVLVLMMLGRSFKLPDHSRWLKPFFAAAVLLLLVEGFGSDSIVNQPWVIGEASLLIGLRFGLGDLDDSPGF